MRVARQIGDPVVGRRALAHVVSMHFLEFSVKVVRHKNQDFCVEICGKRTVEPVSRPLAGSSFDSFVVPLRTWPMVIAIFQECGALFPEYLTVSCDSSYELPAMVDWSDLRRTSLEE